MRTQYAKERSQVVDKHDKKEEQTKDFAKQEPCRVAPETMTATERAQHEALRIQGIGSERTHGGNKHILGSPLVTNSGTRVMQEANYSRGGAVTPVAAATPTPTSATRAGGAVRDVFTFDVKQSPAPRPAVNTKTGLLSWSMVRSASTPNLPHLNTAGASTPTPKGGVKVTTVHESPDESVSLTGAAKK